MSTPNNNNFEYEPDRSLDDQPGTESVDTPPEEKDDPVTRLRNKLTDDSYEPGSEVDTEPEDDGDVTPPPAAHHTTGTISFGLGDGPSGYSVGSSPGQPSSVTPGYEPGFPTQPSTDPWGGYHNQFPPSVPEPYVNAGIHGGYPMSSPVPYDGYERKSMLVAVILGIILGPFGAHNFYLDKTGRAMTQLILTVCSIFTTIILVGFIGLLITGVWSMIEWIIILTDRDYKDGNGHTLDRD